MTGKSGSMASLIPSTSDNSVIPDLTRQKHRSSFAGRPNVQLPCRPHMGQAEESQAAVCAIGKYGSIAMIERFILSMKTEYTNRILIPLDLDEFRQNLTHYAEWYNEHRPHQSLGGRTPQEVYSGSTLSPPVGAGPNSRLPVMELAVTHLHGNRHLPLVKLEKVA